MSTDSTQSMIQVARAIATIAHLGQVDKAGMPYIGHPLRIAESLFWAGHSCEAVAAGWLHDVLEDTAVTAEDFRTLGIPESVIDIVQALSHPKNETREDYYARVKAAGADAVLVKLADIADNTNPERMSLLDEKTRDRLTAKYAKAVRILTS